MKPRAVRRSFVLCVLVAAILAPAAGANTPPTCSDVSASVQNVDPGVTEIPGSPSVKIAAACTDPDPGTVLVYATTGDEPVSGDIGADPAGFVYIAGFGFAGTVTFHYVAHDGTVPSNVATVTVTVIAPPVIDQDPDGDGVIGELDECPRCRDWATRAAARTATGTASQNMTTPARTPPGTTAWTDAQPSSASRSSTGRRVASPPTRAALEPRRGAPPGVADAPDHRHRAPARDGGGRARTAGGGRSRSRRGRSRPAPRGVVVRQRRPRVIPGSRVA